MEEDANPGCFACGAANPIGLGLVFSRVGEEVWAEFTPTPWHQGYEGLIHGGIIATLLDEAMAHALLAQGIQGVTARLAVRFIAPLATGVRVRVRGWIEANRRRLVEARSEIIPAEGGKPIAEAEALFAVAKKTSIEG